MPFARAPSAAAVRGPVAPARKLGQGYARGPGPRRPEGAMTPSAGTMLHDAHCAQSAPEPFGATTGNARTGVVAGGPACGPAALEAQLSDGRSEQATDLLAAMGVDAVVGVAPGAGRTALWDVFAGAGGTAVTDLAFFQLARAFMSTVSAGRWRPPEWLVEAYDGLTRGVRPTKIAVGVSFGPREAAGVLARLHARRGSVVPRTRPGPPGSIGLLLAHLPEWARDAFREQLALVRIPAVRQPLPSWIGRVAAIGDPSFRLLASIRLMDDCVTLRVVNSIRHNLRQTVDCAEIAGPTGSGDPGEARRRLDEYAEGRLVPGIGERLRVKTAEAYPGALRAGRAICRKLLGDRAGEVIALLPVPPARSEGSEEGLARRRTAVLGKAETDRGDDILEFMAILPAVLSGIENRSRQLDGILLSASTALGRAAALIGAGLPVLFDHEGPVIRPDGSPGVGRQASTFEIATAGGLLRRAHALGWPCSADPGLPDPTLVIVFRGHRPLDAGRGSYEPWFVPLFRFGVFEPMVGMPGAVLTGRTAVRGSLGLSLDHVHHEGLLGPPLAWRAVVAAARGRDPVAGDVVIPLLPLIHAMAQGRAVVRSSTRSGTRLAECMQVAIGCQRTHVVGGRLTPYLELKPKGWVTTGRFAIDPGSAALWSHLRLLAATRWHPGFVDEAAAPSLPRIGFGANDRVDLPPARYLLRGPVRACTQEDLNLFVRVLLHGIVDITSHFGRYVFATMLGLAGEGYDTTGPLLHHLRGSLLTPRYDLSDLIMAGDAAERHNQRVDAMIRGLAAHG